MHRGFAKLFRSIRENDLWKGEKFTRGQAWVDLLLLANHQDTVLRIRGNGVRVRRGQVARSEDWLAREWGWSRGKVRRFLAELETVHVMIVQQKNNVISLINIVNFEKYNSNSTPGDTTDNTPDRTTYKKEEKEKDISLFPDPHKADVAPAPEIIPLADQPLIKDCGEKKARATKKTPRLEKVPLPADFGISDVVREWAKRKGHSHLEERIEAFILSAKANGWKYVDWDAAFMNAVRGNWAKIGVGNNHQTTTAQPGVSRDASGRALKYG